MDQQKQDDLEQSFAMAANGEDTDGFIAYIASSEIDNPKLGDTPHELATRAAHRVLGVMEFLSQKPIPSITEVCNDLAAKVIAEDSLTPNFFYADSVRDTAKEAWDHGLSALGEKGETTLTQMVTRLSMF